jgi:uncharacterized protein YbjT (DUF2867 family)
MKERAMYLVMGATGNVGSQVVEELLAAGEPVRVFTREVKKVAQWGDRVEVAIGDMTDAASLRAAAKGVHGVFLMNGTLDGAAFAGLLEALKAEGVRRIVFLSSVLAALPDLAIGQLHKAKEDAIAAAGFEHSIVRATGFMSNVIGQWLPSIRREGVVYNAMGEGRSTLVAPEDIAAVAARALTAATPLETVLNVTGPELLTVPEEVAILSEVLGKPIRAVDVTIDAAAEGMVRNGLPEQVAKAVAASFAAIRDGRVTEVSDTVKRVTGRPPMRFAEWVRKHRLQLA